MSLNHAQKEAVAHFKGPCMVLAGPGSGKTLTIAKRIEYLIQTYEVRPEEILVITFTKYAANEMRQRFQRVMNTTSMPVTFGTFHGIYYGILKWAYHLNQDNILTEDERLELLKEIAGKADWSGDEDLIQNRDFLKELAEEIGNVKNNLKDIDTYISRQYGMGRFRFIYHEYEERKQKLRKIDFEDMIVMCLKLFREYPEILKKWQKKSRFILVDEFQDINQAQYEVIRLLAAPENNLFIVGDDDQSVYGFRGAKPGIMMEFKKDFPDAKQVVLNINYRSTAHIVNGALRVINHNRMRYPKEIRASRKADKTVHVQEVKDSSEEAHYILEHIRDALKEGKKPEEIAVLFRTSSDAGIIAELFMEYQIPFIMKEQLPNLFQHWISRNMMSYLLLAQGDLSRKHFLDVMNRPNRYIARDMVSDTRLSFEKLKEYYKDKDWMCDRITTLETHLRIIKSLPPFAAMNFIRKAVGYEEYLQEYAAYRKMKPEELIEVLERVMESAAGKKDLKEWQDYIEEYSIKLQEQAKKQEIRREGVVISTLHGVKGLEYDNVYIFNVNEGSIPYKKAVLEESLEEERRLFYVGMTRAKKKLTLLYVKRQFEKEREPSRFLEEAGL